jgi:hypothetical protein
MENLSPQQMFHQANADLSKAEKELDRPSDDVVNYAVCMNARRALFYFMNCLSEHYAQSGKDSINQLESLIDHIQYCEKYNKSIRKLDFSCIDCREHDVLHPDELFFCNDVYKVKQCKELADQVKKVVLETVPDLNS